MKKIIAIVLTLALALCGFAALAEADASDPTLRTSFEDGSFIVRIPAKDDYGWYADGESLDSAVIALNSADVIDDAFVARYDAVGDGEATVTIAHYYNASAADAVHTFDLLVKDGAIQEVTGGSYAALSPDDNLNPFLLGEWTSGDNQMTIAQNEDRSFDVEIWMPASHGAYVFRAAAYMDCLSGGLVYDKGKFWEAPITDSEDDQLGEPYAYGQTGSFTFAADDDDNLVMTWHSDLSPDEDMVFTHEDTGSAYTYFPESEACVGTWRTGNYVLTIAHSHADPALFNCVITQYTDDRTGVRWSYADCAYDDIGCALSSFEIGFKSDVTFDEAGEIISSDVLFDDGAAAFALNESGQMVWTDFKTAPDAEPIVFDRESTFVVDYGTSEIFSRADMDDAIALIRETFYTWTGCTLHDLRYASDACAAEEKLAWLNGLRDGAEFAQCIGFLSDFHSPAEGGGAWEADTEYRDYEWWLARPEGGQWTLVTWGY